MGDASDILDPVVRASYLFAAFGNPVQPMPDFPGNRTARRRAAANRRRGKR